MLLWKIFTILSTLFATPLVYFLWVLYGEMDVYCGHRDNPFHHTGECKDIGATFAVIFPLAVIALLPLLCTLIYKCYRDPVSERDKDNA